MTLTFSRIILTLLIAYLGFLIWTKNVDLIVWGKNRLAKFLPINNEEKKGYKLDFSYDKMMIADMRSDNKSVNNKVVILFYDINIVNQNNFTTTIKEIKGTLNIETSAIPLKVYNIRINKLKSGSESIVAIYENKNTKKVDKLNIVGWKNINLILNQKKLLSHGEVLSGSILFITDYHPSQFSSLKIDNIQIEILDYMGNNSKQKIDFNKNHIRNFLEKKFKILDKQDLIDEN